MTIAARRATPKAFAEPSLSGFYSHLDGPAALVNMALVAEEARLQTALQCIGMSQCHGGARTDARRLESSSHEDHDLSRQSTVKAQDGQRASEEAGRQVEALRNLAQRFDR